MNHKQPGRPCTAASLVALVVLWFIATFMLFCGVALGGRDEPHPDWARVVRCGCRIDQIDPPANYSGGITRFRLVVQAWYARVDKPWEDPRGMYEAGENDRGRMDAMKECDRWLQAAKDAIRRAREEATK